MIMMMMMMMLGQHQCRGNKFCFSRNSSKSRCHLQAILHLLFRPGSENVWGSECARNKTQYFPAWKARVYVTTSCKQQSHHNIRLPLRGWRVQNWEHWCKIHQPLVIISHKLMWDSVEPHWLRPSSDSAVLHCSDLRHVQHCRLLKDSGHGCVSRARRAGPMLTRKNAQDVLVVCGVFTWVNWHNYGKSSF